MPGPGQLLVPGSAGGQERYRKSCARDPSPTTPCTVALAPVPSVSPMISVLCLAELLQCFSSHESCVIGCHSFPCCLVFHRIFGSTTLRGDFRVRIIAAARRLCHLSQDTLGFIQVLHPARHTLGSVQFLLSQNIRILGRLLSMTSQLPRGRGAAAPRGYTALL